MLSHVIRPTTRSGGALELMNTCFVSGLTCTEHRSSQLEQIQQQRTVHVPDSARTPQVRPRGPCQPTTHSPRDAPAEQRNERRKSKHKPHRNQRFVCYRCKGPSGHHDVAAEHDDGQNQLKSARARWHLALGTHLCTCMMLI